MNFLAHIYLSGNNKLLMVGNFIGDAVKGRRYEGLQPIVRKGVLMHRAIDDFTDRHPINAKIRKLLHPHFGKYAGVYLDMFYDHFLAAGWNDFSKEVSLKTFCNRFYFDAILKYKYLPLKIRLLLNIFIIGNRLKNYSKLDSLRDSLEMMHKYLNLPVTGEYAIKCLEDNYDAIKAAFYEFFPLLINYTRIWRENSDNRVQLPDSFLTRFKNQSNLSNMLSNG
ncbi:MAG: ACP phosphodiesterase [Prevotellaceae bacterium]|jgi:acyl carrier protein phosphodiesterase|nr:ACP phosphodiesterase [Prevotellaceae bacterium]